MSKPAELELKLHGDPGVEEVQVRIQRIGNGFLVKAGKDPFFYPTIDEAGDAVKEAAIVAFHYDQ